MINSKIIKTKKYRQAVNKESNGVVKYIQFILFDKMADPSRKPHCVGCNSNGHFVDTCVETIERKTGQKGIYLEFVFDQNLEIRVTLDNHPFRETQGVMVFLTKNGETVIVRQMGPNHFGLYGKEPLKIQIEKGTTDLLKLSWTDCALGTGERYDVKNYHVVTRIRQEEWLDNIVRNPRGTLRFKSLKGMFDRPIKAVVHGVDHIIVKKKQVWMMPCYEWNLTTEYIIDELTANFHGQHQSSEQGLRSNLLAIMPPSPDHEAKVEQPESSSSSHSEQEGAVGEVKPQTWEGLREWYGKN